jgi:hypothetical protein
MRKIGLMMLSVVVCLCILSASAFASGKNINVIEADKLISKDDVQKQSKNTFATYDDVFKAHGGKHESLDLSKLPEGTPVINVKSKAELDALLTSIRPKGLTENVVIDPSNLPKTSSKMMTAAASSSGVLSTTIMTAYYYWVSLYSNYALTQQSGGDWIISTVSASTGINGVNFSVSWTQTAANSVKITDKKWFTTGSGYLTLNLIINGVGSIYTESFNGSHYVTIS